MNPMNVCSIIKDILKKSFYLRFTSTETKKGLRSSKEKDGKRWKQNEKKEFLSKSHETGLYFWSFRFKGKLFFRFLKFSFNRLTWSWVNYLCTVTSSKKFRRKKRSNKKCGGKEWRKNAEKCCWFRIIKIPTKMNVYWRHAYLLKCVKMKIFIYF